ncbi:MAG: TonB-dependent receptor [Deltaproteobacteria bacterium]|nr:TonB-dependent receptor [Deltaproteobacteria bacterium]
MIGWGLRRRGVFAPRGGLRLLPSVLGLALALAALPALAQEEETTPDELGDLGELDLGELDMGDEFALLAEEDIVVSATRHAQRISESPSTVTVLTRKDIERSGATNVADLLRRVPGVDIFKVSTAQPIMGIRTNSTIAGDLILVLIDGRNAAMSAFGTVNWTGLPVDVGSIERIEVIRGPGSSIYGANALQGVVNIITRRPGEDAVQAEVDAWGAWGTNVELDLRAHGTLGKHGWWVSGGLSRLSPLDDPQNLLLSSNRLRLSYAYTPAEDRRLGVELGYSLIDTNLYTVVSDVDFLAHWGYLRGSLDWGGFHAQLVLDLPRTRAHFQFPLYLDTGNGEPILLAEMPPMTIVTPGTEFELHQDLTLHEDLRLIAGFSGRLYHHSSKEAVTCPEVPFSAFDIDQCSDLSKWEVAAGPFAQAEWKLLERLTLTAGMRLDWNSLYPDLGLSPRVALVWAATDEHALRASAGRAYRKPTTTESFSHVRLEGGENAPPDIVRRLQHIFGTSLGNEDLIFELSDSAELGWRGAFLEGELDVTLDLFYAVHRNPIWMQVENLVETFAGVPRISDDAVVEFRNGDGETTSVGGELMISWKPDERLELMVAYARDQVLSQPPDAPPFQLEPTHRLIGSLRLRPLEGLHLGVDAFWASAYADEVGDPDSIFAESTRVDMGAWTTLNATASYRLTFAERSVELGVAADNLLDPEGRREAAGSDRATGGSYGGERLRRQVRVFLRGRF